MIRIATRGSALALVQAQLAADALARRHPGETFRLEPITTRGDRARAMPLVEASQEGIFVKELEQALREGRAELAVHSAKDLPTTPSPDLVLCAYLPRADPRDVLIGRAPVTLRTLPAGAKVGTGSPRRAAQLRAVRGDLEPAPIRGNVDTRIKRLQQGAVDALILASAGLERLGRSGEVHEILPLEVMLPAPGQGALVIQAAAGSAAASVAATVDHAPTRRAVDAERAVLRQLGGGCLTPVAVYGEVVDSQLTVTAAVFSSDGRESVRAREQGSPDAEVVARVVARLRSQGADALLRGDRLGTPLKGVRVLVTRAGAQAAGFTGALRDAGATVVELPVIAIEPVRHPGDGGVPDLSRYDWLIFTSVNAVDRFAALLDETAGALPLRQRVAAIGSETAARLEGYGISVHVVPARFVAEELASALAAEHVAGKRILLPRAEGAREVLPEMLRAQGAIVDVVELYRAVAPPGLSTRLKDQLQEGVDVVTFTSSSTVRHFVDALGTDRGLVEGIRIACIGPITADTARRAGLQVDIIAEEFTTRGLVQALVDDRRRGSP